MSGPEVTVVIPTRDRVGLLSRTLGSVLAQEDVDLEVVVVDEASSDGTPDFLTALDDRRVRVVRNDPPLGVSGARNAGIAAARGRWLAFTDDDDLWAPRKLVSQLDALRADPAARWATTSGVVIDPDLEIVCGDPAPAAGDVAAPLLGDNRIPAGGSSVLADAGLVGEVGGFDPELRQLADWDLWIRLALRSPVAVVDRPLVGYTQHDGGMSHAADGVDDELEVVFARYDEERRRLGVRDTWDYWWLWMAERRHRAGDRVGALRLHARVLRRYRHWRVAPTALAGLVAPRTTARAIDRGRRRRMPASWFDEARAWLAAVGPAQPGTAEASSSTSADAWRRLS